MRVLLVNNGPSHGTASRRYWRQAVPQSARDAIKPMVAMLPAAVQRAILPNFGISERRFPLGLGYLSATLKSLGDHQVKLVDRFADPGAWVNNVDDFDFVGVYSSTPFFDDCLEIVARLQRERFRGKIAFGGPHTTVQPTTVPPRVDYIVQGEGESIINDLVLGKYASGTLIRTARVENLDELPPADYGLFLDQPRGYQLDFPYSERKPVFALNTSRSCPYACSFCGVRDIWGRLWRAQSAEYVVNDIQRLKRDFGCAGVYFREDLFTGNHARVRQICEMLLERSVDVVWACETRVDAGADEDLVRLMAASGCRGIYIGAESGSQRMLDKYNKEIRVQDIWHTCSNAKKYGIATYMSLIVAHPDEQWSDKWATAKLILGTRPEVVGLAPYRAEFARHGSVNYPTYPSRIAIQEQRAGTTWGGQKDRLALVAGQ